MGKVFKNTTSDTKKHLTHNKGNQKRFNKKGSTIKKNIPKREFDKIRKVKKQ
jgi:hypothetical protein